MRHLLPLRRNIYIVRQTSTLSKTAFVSSPVAWYAWEVVALHALVEMHLLIANHRIRALSRKGLTASKAAVDKANSANGIKQPNWDALDCRTAIEAV